MKLANFTREHTDVLTGGPAIVSSSAVSTHVSGTASMHVATAVTIADAGNYYTSGTVEGALQELGAASSDMLVYDEGGLAGTATSFDFQGAGVSAAVSGGTAIVTVGTASTSIPIYDEGSLMGTATTGLNFVGSGVSGTVTSGTAVITITGGGSLTHTFLGYNTIGGSGETVTANRWYMKQVTPSSDGMITAISFYATWAEDYLYHIVAGIATDSGSDTPDLFVATGDAGPNIDLSGAGGTAFTGRWFHIPINFWATASTKYWIGIQMARQGGGGTYPSLKYDGSGSDRYWTPGGFWQGDPVWANGGSQTDSTRKYSIRADFVY